MILNSWLNDFWTAWWWHLYFTSYVKKFFLYCHSILKKHKEYLNYFAFLFRFGGKLSLKVSFSPSSFFPFLSCFSFFSLLLGVYATDQLNDYLARTTCRQSPTTKAGRSSSDVNHSDATDPSPSRFQSIPDAICEDGGFCRLEPGGRQLLCKCIYPWLVGRGLVILAASVTISPPTLSSSAPPAFRSRAATPSFERKRPMRSKETN